MPCGHPINDSVSFLFLNFIGKRMFKKQLKLFRSENALIFFVICVNLILVRLFLDRFGYSGLCIACMLGCLGFN